MSDLRFCERLLSYTLDSGDSNDIRTNIKVSSTGMGTTFGNIVYGFAGSGANTGCAIFNDVHVNKMEYIKLRKGQCVRLSYDEG